MTICSRLRSCRIVRPVILPASFRILSITFWQWHRLLKPEETDPFSWHLTSVIFYMAAIKKPKCLGMTNFICLLSASALFVRFASTYTVRLGNASLRLVCLFHPATSIRREVFCLSRNGTVKMLPHLHCSRLPRIFAAVFIYFWAIRKSTP